MAVYKPEDVGETIGQWIVETAKTNVEFQRIRWQMLVLSAKVVNKENPSDSEVVAVMGAIYGAAMGFLMPIADKDRMTVLQIVLKQIVNSSTEQELDTLGR